MTDASSDDSVGHDRIEANLGADGENVVVGKNIDTRRRRNDQHNAQHVEVNLPEISDRQPRLADIYNVLADDPLRGTPGLVSKVNNIERRRWLKAFGRFR